MHFTNNKKAIFMPVNNKVTAVQNTYILLAYANYINAQNPKKSTFYYHLINFEQAVLMPVFRFNRSLFLFFRYENRFSLI